MPSSDADTTLLHAAELDARSADRDPAQSAAERMAFLETRVHEKIDDYENYRFTLPESRALNIFFDLAQEFSNVFDLYALCVTVPKTFFQKHAELYLIGNDGRLAWRADSAHGCEGDPAKHPPPALIFEPTEQGGRYHIPIKGNQELLKQLSFTPEHGVIGLLVVSPGTNLSDHERLFFEKYTNRIGFQIHNRLIGEKNREHLQFIRTLVDDIGHNVIVPNMYFKLFYRRLESKILVLRDISREFARFTDQCRLEEGRTKACTRLRRELDYTYDSLMEQFREIYRHYEQTSMFLETLLRRGHFEKGHYVLEKQPVNLKYQIVAPQIERYAARLQERGIEVEQPPPGNLDENLEAVADVGLVSQVFANFFSNAVKYTREVRDENGKRHCFVTYGCRLVPDHFGPGRDAVRCEVFSSGPNLPPEEAERLYSEGFRGGNVQGEYGTGHGLHFIREVVTLHGGEVGYEPSKLGNTFFFLLPSSPRPAPDDARRP